MLSPRVAWQRLAHMQRVVWTQPEVAYAVWQMSLLDQLELTVTKDPQRYSCIESRARYRYESLDSDFVREIETDRDGLVVIYPGLFRRIY